MRGIAVSAALFIAPAVPAAPRLTEVRLVDGRDPLRTLVPPEDKSWQAVAAAFTGRILTKETLTEITGRLLDHYARCGWPVVDVEIPVSGVTRDGRLTIAVTEGRFGLMSLTGGPRGTQRALAPGWQKMSGEPVTLDALSRELEWWHRNPMHTVIPSLAPGVEPGTADGLLRLDSSEAVRWSLWWINDGIEPLPEHHFSLGVETADVLGLPSHFIGLAQFADDPEAWHSYRGNLRLFLPWHHELQISGLWTRAVLDRTVVLDPFSASIEATHWMATARYVVPFYMGGWTLDASLGADFRRTDSSLDFGVLRAAGEADTVQFVSGLSLRRDTDTHYTFVAADAVWSPGNVTESHSDENHAALRPGAEANYVLARAMGMHRITFQSGWSAGVTVGAQWSSDPVLPAEMLALGSGQAVRGYPESSALCDSGVWGSLELRAPAWSLSSPLAIQPVAFFDAGAGRDAARDDHFSVASAGGGLRVNWRRSMQLALDYAWRLTEPGGRAHVSLRFEF